VVKSGGEQNIIQKTLIRSVHWSGSLLRVQLRARIVVEVTSRAIHKRRIRTKLLRTKESECEKKSFTTLEFASVWVPKEISLDIKNIYFYFLGIAMYP